MSIFYLDYANGSDATTATPLGWWSIAYTSGNGTTPPADQIATGGTSGATAKLTIIAQVTSGTWGGGNAAGTLYFYGKSGTFQAETLTFTNGATCSIGAGDLVYCAWKTITSGATTARIAPGDTIRIAKSPTPTSIGNGIWTPTTTVGGGFPATVAITSSTNATPIVITKVAHGFVNGDIIQVIGHTTNTTANGVWVVANKTADTLELAGSVGVGVGGATGTMQKITSKVIQLASAQTAMVAPCETVWTAIAGGDCTPTLTSADRKEGGYAATLTMDSATQASVGQAYFATGTLNLSAYQTISFWIKNSAAIADANTYAVKLCSDTAGATPVDSFVIPAIPSTGQWVPLTITKTGGGNLGASIQSIAIYTGTTAPTNSSNIIVDNFVACTTNGLSLTTIISKNSADQGGAEGWYPIQSIDKSGKLVVIDNGVQTLSNAGRGYYGTTETVTTYIRSTISTTMVSTVGGASQHVVQESGTFGNLDTYDGGYNTATNAQDGETFWDGQNGFGLGFSLAAKSYVKVNHLSFVRYGTGISMITATCTANQIDNVQTICACTTLGISVVNQDNLVIGTIILLNNSANGITSTIMQNAVATSITSNNNIASGCSLSTGGWYITTYNGNNNSGIGGSISNSGIIIVTANTNYNNAAGAGLAGNIIIIKTLNSSANNTYGLTFGNSMCNGKVYNYTSSLNATASIQGGIDTINYIYNTSIAEGTVISMTDGAASKPFPDAKVFIGKFGGDTTVSKIYYNGGTATTQTTTRHTASGVAWELSPTAAKITQVYNSLEIPLGKIAVNANAQVTATIYGYRDNANLNVQFTCRGVQLAGMTTADYTSAVTSTSAWDQLTITFTPTEAGVVEFIGQVWASDGGTTYNGYFDDIAFSQA
jgi:hypothetical protein